MQLAVQLKANLSNLQQALSRNDGTTSALPEHDQEHHSHTLRDLVIGVMSNEPQIGFMSDLQHAWQSAIGGYDETQAGNCLFWLFEEPSIHRSRDGHSRNSSSDWGSAFHAEQLDGHNFASAPQMAASQAGGMQQALPQQQLQHFDGPASGLASTTSRRDSQTESAATSSFTSRPSEAQQGQRESSGGSGWTTGLVVLVAVTSSAFGVLIGSYPQRSDAMHGLTRVSETCLNIAGGIVSDILQERKQKRQAASAQERDYHQR